MSLYKDITLVELQKDDKVDKVLRQISILKYVEKAVVPRLYTMVPISLANTSLNTWNLSQLCGCGRV
jgi:hypothetical protein